MYIFSDFSKFIFYFLTYIEEECYSVVILAKSSALFHAKIFQTPCSNFFARSAHKTPDFSLYKVGTYGKLDSPNTVFSAQTGVSLQVHQEHTWYVSVLLIKTPFC